MSYRNNKNNNNNFKKVIMNNNNNTKLIRKYINNSNTPKKGMYQNVKNHKYKICLFICVAICIIIPILLHIKGVFNSSDSSKSETQIRQEMEAQAAIDKTEQAEEDENTLNQNKAERKEILKNILTNDDNIQIIDSSNVPLSKLRDQPINESVQKTIQNLIDDIDNSPTDDQGKVIVDIVGLYYHIEETGKITYFYIKGHFDHKRITGSLDDYEKNDNNEQYLLFKKEYSELAPVIHTNTLEVHFNNYIPNTTYQIPSGSKNNSVPETIPGSFSNTKPPQKNTNYYNNIESFNTKGPDVCFDELTEDDLIGKPEQIVGGEDISEIHQNLIPYLNKLKTQQDPKIYWVKIITTHEFDTNKFNYIIQFYKKGNIKLKPKSEITNVFCYRNNSQFTTDTINDLNEALVLQKGLTKDASDAKDDADEDRDDAVKALGDSVKETRKKKEEELAHYQDQVQNIIRDDIIKDCNNEKITETAYNLITKKSYNLDTVLKTIKKKIKSDYTDTDDQPIYEVQYSRYLKQYLLKDLPDILKNEDNTDVLDKSNPIYLANKKYEYEQYDSIGTDDKYNKVYITCFCIIPLIFSILWFLLRYLYDKFREDDYKNSKKSGLCCCIIFMLGISSIPVLLLTNTGIETERNQISFKPVPILDPTSIFSHFINDKTEETCSKHIIKPKIFYVEKPSYNQKYVSTAGYFNGTHNIIFVIFDGKVKEKDSDGNDITPKVSFPDSKHIDSGTNTPIEVSLEPFNEKQYTDYDTRTGITDIYRPNNIDDTKKKKEILDAHKKKSDFYNRRLWYVKSDDVKKLKLEPEKSYTIKFVNDIEYESDQYLTDSFKSTKQKENFTGLIETQHLTNPGCYKKHPIGCYSEKREDWSEKWKPSVHTMPLDEKDCAIKDMKAYCHKNDVSVKYFTETDFTETDNITDQLEEDQGPGCYVKAPTGCYSTNTMNKDTINIWMTDDATKEACNEEKQEEMNEFCNIKDINVKYFTETDIVKEKSDELLSKAEKAQKETETKFNKLTFYGVKTNTEVSFNVKFPQERSELTKIKTNIDKYLKNALEPVKNFKTIWGWFIICYWIAIVSICFLFIHIFEYVYDKKKKETKQNGGGDYWNKIKELFTTLIGFRSRSIILFATILLSVVGTWILYGVIQSYRKNMYNSDGTIDIHKDIDSDNFKSLNEIDIRAYEDYKYTDMEIKSDMREDMSFEAKLGDISVFNPNLIYKIESKKFVTNTTEISTLQNKYDETKEEEMKNYKNALVKIKTKLETNKLNNKIIFNMKEFIKMDQNIPNGYILGTITIGTTPKDIKYFKKTEEVTPDADFAYLKLSGTPNSNLYYKQIEITIPTGIIKLDETSNEILPKIEIDLKSIVIDVQKSAKPLIFENKIDIEETGIKVSDLKTKFDDDEFTAYNVAVTAEISAVNEKIVALSKDETSGTPEKTETDEDDSKSIYYHIITSISTILLIIICSYFYSNEGKSFRDINLIDKIKGTAIINILFSLLAIVFNILLIYKPSLDMWMWASYITVVVIYIASFFTSFWFKIGFLEMMASMANIFMFCNCNIG